MEKRYRMMKNAGALQEGAKMEAYSSASETTGEYPSARSWVPQQQVPSPWGGDPTYGTQRFAPPPPPAGMMQMTVDPTYADLHNTSTGMPAFHAHDAQISSTRKRAHGPQVQDLDQYFRQEQAGAFGGSNLSSDGVLSRMEDTQMGWFSYTVSEGQRVLMLERSGSGTLLDGPCRVPRWGRKFLKLQQYVAFPGEFLLVRYRDGKQEHVPGPAKVWFDPRVHALIEKEDALQIAAKEAIVVYSQGEGEDAHVRRRLVTGPAVFIPQPGEWLHTFAWHGSGGVGGRKVPGALKFQKLWLMPDQMYHDVEDVRTADDVVLTIKLMLFFELSEVEKMLDETHDPIGDFINSATSDVIDLVGRYSFDQFKEKTERLNDLKSYPQLMGRAKQVGYEIRKIVYRGYSTAATLQAMHEQAIEARTRLKLERETENQTQELADFKQKRAAERTRLSQQEEKLRHEHDLGLQERRHEQDLRLLREQWEEQQKKQAAEREDELQHQAKVLSQQVDFFQKIRGLDVDLTEYLTQYRADQVIEFRGQDGSISPHVHTPSRSKR